MPETYDIRSEDLQFLLRPHCVPACPSAASPSFAVTSDGRYATVATIVGTTLVAIDTATRTVAATLPSGPYPNDVLVAP